ncbi:SMI1/KNR4 family protein [Actinomadura violacea]|uniref:SMI1/KNR4 family protein n=1 Tax=Actinomadura violacea TaxID=2819934 RepID=A0ABS3S9R1_9ACTN|nr:SMI1/KNR4 family protein [Actinomadura violacea]MBO2465749.1 SMI1/KNR4 family protein [Actinomadura violacea]
MTENDLAGFRRAWGRFETWLATHSPADHVALLPPATAEEIAAVEDAYGFSLHPQVRALLQLHDGTPGPRASFDPGQFVPGRHHLAGCAEIMGYCQVLADLSEDWAEAFAGEDSDDTDVDEPVEAHLDYWVPFASTNDGGMAIVDHYPGATYGQVYEAGLGSGGLPEFWAADLADLFDRIATAVETDTSFLHYTPTMCEWPSEDGGQTTRSLEW